MMYFVHLREEKKVGVFTHQVLLSRMLPPNSAVICFTIEGALLISVYQSTEITCISLTPPAPIMKLVKS